MTLMKHTVSNSDLSCKFPLLNQLTIVTLAHVEVVWYPFRVLIHAVFDIKCSILAPSTTFDFSQGFEFLALMGFVYDQVTT